MNKNSHKIQKRHQDYSTYILI